jgi:hypothetical protein
LVPITFFARIALVCPLAVGMTKFLAAGQTRWEADTGASRGWLQ